MRVLRVEDVVADMIAYKGACDAENEGCKHVEDGGGPVARLDVVHTLNREGAEGGEAAAEAYGGEEEQWLLKGEAYEDSHQQGTEDVGAHGGDLGGPVEGFKG